jgi:hypothetical protein
MGGEEPLEDAKAFECMMDGKRFATKPGEGVVDEKTVVDQKENPETKQP